MNIFHLKPWITNEPVTRSYICFDQFKDPVDIGEPFACSSQGNLFSIYSYGGMGYEIVKTPAKQTVFKFQSSNSPTIEALTKLFQSTFPNMDQPPPPSSERVRSYQIILDTPSIRKGICAVCDCSEEDPFDPNGTNFKTNLEKNITAFLENPNNSHLKEYRYLEEILKWTTPALTNIAVESRLNRYDCSPGDRCDFIGLMKPYFGVKLTDAPEIVAKSHLLKDLKGHVLANIEILKNSSPPLQQDTKEWLALTHLFNEISSCTTNKAVKDALCRIYSASTETAAILRTLENHLGATIADSPETFSQAVSNSKPWSDTLKKNVIENIAILRLDQAPYSKEQTYLKQLLTSILGFQGDLGVEIVLNPSNQTSEIASFLSILHLSFGLDLTDSPDLFSKKINDHHPLDSDSVTNMILNLESLLPHAPKKEKDIVRQLIGDLSSHGGEIGRLLCLNAFQSESQVKARFLEKLGNTYGSSLTELPEIFCNRLLPFEPSHPTLYAEPESGHALSVVDEEEPSFTQKVIHSVTESEPVSF